jgi:hypothetical protein
MGSFMYNDREITYVICKNNIRISDSYKVEAKAEMIEILARVRADAEAQGFTYKRPIRSWLREWQAHNFLYVIGIARKRTGSVDLNEDESLLKRLCYNILAPLYWY